MHYYLLNSSRPIIFRTDQPGLRAKVYQFWDFTTRKWVDSPFGSGRSNMLSDDFDRGSYGFVSTTEAQADQIIARGSLLGD